MPLLAMPMTRSPGTMSRPTKMRSSATVPIAVPTRSNPFTMSGSCEISPPEIDTPAWRAPSARPIPTPSRTSAAGLAGARGEADRDAIEHCGVSAVDRDVIDHRDRPGTDAEEVVDVHRDAVDADRVVLP